MGIMITKVRISNYRSIELLDINLNMTNVLIGANNSGKSNFLKAINIALGQNRIVSALDIFVGKDEVLNEDKQSIIDIMIRPTNDNDETVQEFSDFWNGVFTEDWITVGDLFGNYVGIRTCIQFDKLRNDYIIIHKSILNWGNSLNSAIVSRRKAFTRDMNDYISAFYMDAQRDVVEDLRDRKSYFGRATSRIDLPVDKVLDIENRLNDANSQIVESIPALNQTASRIAFIAPTIGSLNSIVEIEPLARKISDLHKGMDIVFRDGEAAKLSVSQHGMGTRSWISFLTLGAYVDWEKNSMLEDDPESESYIMLTMEEPEAHLHPQAQQKLYSQLCSFSGQKIISTHSTNIVAQAELENLIHFEKVNGKTNAIAFDSISFEQEEKNRIRRELISSRGELLFSRAIVLCEGITEEQSLPIFFKEYFGIEPVFCGVSIIGIGGQNYKTFLPLIKNFNIDWFIFSDGEKSTIKTVGNAVRKTFDKELHEFNNVIILDNNEDYEKHLINSGYENEIITAIGEYEGNSNFVNEYAKKRNNTVLTRKKTDSPKCPTCKQDIYEDVLRDYSGLEGWKKAIYDCCTDKQAKAKYAVPVAEKIVLIDDKSRRIPPKIKELMEALNPIFNSEGEICNEFVTETTTNS